MKKSLISIIFIMLLLLLSACNEDTEAPVIAIDNSTITLSVGDTFAMPSCTVTDNKDEDLSCIISGETVDEFTPGEYVILINAEDENKNMSDQIELKVIVVDLEIPVIDVNDNDLVIEVGGIYLAPTCTVYDNYDTNLTCIIAGDLVDVDTIGVYVIRYDAIDSNLNSAVQRIKEVTVLDTTLPLIEVDPTPVSIPSGNVFVMPPCNVVDNYDAGLVCNITGDTFDTTVLGEHIITIDAVDSSGNSAVQIVLVVNVFDNEAPVINMVAPDLVLALNESFIMPDCSVIDDVDDDLECIINDDSVDITQMGTYVVLINALDNNGKQAIEIMFTVYVGYTGIVAYNDYLFDVEAKTITEYNGPYFVDIVIPDMIYGIPVEVIGEEAFYGTRIFSVVIPESIVSIESDAFDITMLTLDSVTILGDITRFTDMWYQSGLPLSNYDGYEYSTLNGMIYEFYGVISSEIYTVPTVINGTTITAIYTDAYEDNMNFEPTEVIIPEGIEFIGEYAFNYLDIPALTLPSSLVSIGFNAFAGTDLLSITINGDADRFDDEWLTIGFPIELADQAKYITEDGFVFEISSGHIVDYIIFIPSGYSLTIPNTIDGNIVTGIGNNVFENIAIGELVLPETITFIGERAFLGHSDNGIIIPESVVTIGDNAFYSMDGYAVGIQGVSNRFDDRWEAIGFPEHQNPNIIIENGIEFNTLTNTILFYNDPLATSIVIPNSIGGEDVLYIDNLAFSVLAGSLTSITLPDTLLSINYGSFYKLQITSITIPASVTYISESAFVDIPFDIDGVVILGNENRFDDNWYSIGFPMPSYNGYTFDKETGTILAYDESFGSDIVIPSMIDGVEVKVIGDKAFYESGLDSVVIPNTVTRIGYAAFRGNDIDSIIIPNSVIIIDNEGFAETGLISVTLSSNLQIIGEYAFYYNDIETIIIPDSVLLIAEGAFYYNGMESVTIGSGVILIEEDAFYDNQLVTIDILGDESRFDETWEEIGFPLELLAD